MAQSSVLLTFFFRRFELKIVTNCFRRCNSILLFFFFLFSYFFFSFSFFILFIFLFFLYLHNVFYMSVFLYLEASSVCPSSSAIDQTRLNRANKPPVLIPHIYLSTLSVPFRPKFTFKYLPRLFSLSCGKKKYHSNDAG